MKDSQCFGSGLIVTNHPEWVGVLESPSASPCPPPPTFYAKWQLLPGFPPPSKWDALSLRVGCTFFFGGGGKWVLERGCQLFSFACCFNLFLCTKNNEVFTLLKYLSLIKTHPQSFSFCSLPVQSFLIHPHLCQTWYGLCVQCLLQSCWACWVCTDAGQWLLLCLIDACLDLTWMSSWVSQTLCLSFNVNSVLKLSLKCFQFCLCKQLF